MAIRTFNSVGGYSVGEVPDTIIYSNGDIVTANATFTTNLDVGTLLAGNGNITVGDTIVAGNVRSDHLLHIDGTPWDFATASGDSGWVQYSNGTDLTASGNFIYVDAATLTDTSVLTIGNATSNAQVFIGTSASNTVINNGNISLSGNVTFENTTQIGNIQGAGVGIDLYAPSGTDYAQLNYDNTNFIFVDASNAAMKTSGGDYSAILDTNGNFTVSAPNTVFTNDIYAQSLDNNGYIVFTNGDGKLVQDSTLTYLNGNLSATNVDITTNLFIGNSTSNVTITNGNVTTTGNIQVGTGSSNVVIDNTGNINATGTIAANTITFTGNIQAPGMNTYVVFNDQGNLNAVSGLTFDQTSNTLSIGGTGGDLTLTGGNISGANNISANSLTLSNDAIISGNLFVAGTTTYVNTTTLAVEDPILQLGGGANNATLTSYDSSDRGTLLHYYDNGSSTAVDAFMGWDTSNSQFIFGSNVSYSAGSPQTVTVNTYGNILAGNANLGNLTTSNYFHGAFDATSNIQSNIDTLGTLTGLTSTGTVDFTSASNVSLGPIGNVHITGGDDGQIIATDGFGNLYWTSSPQVTEIQHGTSNVNIPDINGNINLSSGGNANVVVVTNTGANVAGTLNVTGNVVLGNTTANSYTVGNTSIKAATLTTTATTAGQTIVSVDVYGTSIRGIEFFIKGENSTDNKYRIATVSAVHDSNGHVDFSETTVATGSGSLSPGTLSVTMSGTVISLVVTPAFTSSTVWTTQYRTI